uniref:Uncharacterized protein n=1 Tax=Lactuca sativa TaxID=4236 RepID=A0A9R1XCZ7_LACSA|nr:hypothetical protein LSAT_V11C400221290 [Lactuca sativa]
MVKFITILVPHLTSRLIAPLKHPTCKARRENPNRDIFSSKTQWCCGVYVQIWRKSMLDVVTGGIRQSFPLGYTMVESSPNFLEESTSKENKRI